MAQRGADPGCDRHHRTDTGDDCDVYLAPLPRAFFQGFAYGSSHSKHARVAAGYDCDRLSFGSRPQCFFSALDFLSVV